MEREKNMRELFEAIGRCEPYTTNVVMTALDGKNLGEKILISNGKIVWENREEAFFRKHEEEVCKLEGCGIKEVDGCRIFCDTLGRERRLVVCGGGHVAISVVSVGAMLGWNVTVLEDREEFAERAKEKGATRVLCGAYEEELDKIEGDKDTYFVIATRGHRYDQICLEKIVDKEHAYIGMIGSRNRIATVKKEVLEKGKKQEVLDELHAPIGLNIGSETPEEIGVSIIGEIIEIKSKKQKTFGYSQDIVRAVTCEGNSLQDKVMVTIIDRKGSAPQGVGVKMLVLADGTCVGTIGGGCTEAKVSQKALEMLKEKENKCCIYHPNFVDESEQDCCSVCGGVVDVLLELIEGKNYA